MAKTRSGKKGDDKESESPPQSLGKIKKPPLKKRNSPESSESSESEEEGGGKQTKSTAKKNFLPFTLTRQRKVRKFMMDSTQHEDYMTDPWYEKVIQSLREEKKSGRHVSVEDVRQWIVESPELFERAQPQAGSSASQLGGPGTSGVNMASGSGSITPTVPDLEETGNQEENLEKVKKLPPKKRNRKGSDSEEEGGGSQAKSNAKKKFLPFTLTRQGRVWKFMRDSTQHDDYMTDPWFEKVIRSLHEEKKSGRHVSVEDVRQWIIDSPERFERVTTQPQSGSGSSQSVGPGTSGVNVASGSGSIPPAHDPNAALVSGTSTAASGTTASEGSIEEMDATGNLEPILIDLEMDSDNENDNLGAGSTTGGHSQKVEVPSTSATATTSINVQSTSRSLLSQSTPASSSKQQQVPAAVADSSDEEDSFERALAMIAFEQNNIVPVIPGYQQQAQDTITPLVETLRERSEEVLTTLTELGGEAANNPNPNPALTTAVANAERAAQLLKYFVNEMK